MILSLDSLRSLCLSRLFMNLQNLRGDAIKAAVERALGNSDTAKAK
jgi:hypothetical protein